MINTNSHFPADQARLAQMFKALGNPIRFQIVQWLSERQACMTQEIVAATPLAQSTVSQHLKVLREAGLIRGEIEGPATCYCIDPDGVRWLKDQIEGWLPGCCAPAEIQLKEDKVSMTQAAEAYFDRVAGDWDAIRAGYFTEAVREAAIARAYLRPAMIVADVGSGTGFMAAGLAPLAARVYALDGSPAMLEQARRNLAQHDNVSFELMQDGAIPLPDASVDAVFANMFLHHCTDPLAAIREMARILRPGGRLVISDMDAHDQTWMLEEMADVWAGFERSQVAAWLREAGLVNAYVERSDQSCCATSQTEPAAQAKISIFVAAGAKRVAGAREAVRESYGAAAAAGSACCTPVETTDVADASGWTADIPLSTSCCAPSAESLLAKKGYQGEALAGVPSEAAEFTLGCGNPTALASLRPGETVLDIGSGGGLDAFLASQRVGPGGRVIGVDMTPQMLERARASAKRSGIANVEFRQGHAEALPAEDGTVDVILSNCVINLCEDKGRVFEEAFRVLRTGGRMSVSDVVAQGALPPAGQRDPAQWAGCIHGALPEQEYLALIRAAGFSDVTVEGRSGYSEVEGVGLRSIAVTAHKGQPAAATRGGCCSQ